jgi:hypothetical protein
MLAQHTDESFRADQVRFWNAGGAVVHVLMRSDFFATEAFFCDHGRHLCVSWTTAPRYVVRTATPSTVPPSSAAFARWAFAIGRPQ